MDLVAQQPRCRSYSRLRLVTRESHRVDRSSRSNGIAGRRNSHQVCYEHAAFTRRYPRDVRLLCSTGTFSRNPDYTTYQQVLRYAPLLVADKGVEGFELLFYSSWYPHLDRIAHNLEQSGLEFPVMHAEKNIGTALGNPRPEQREQGVIWLVENCRLGQLLGAKLLVLHLWGWPELDDHLGYNLQLLSRCLDIASEHGVALAIETIPARHASPLSNIRRAIAQDERCRVALDTRLLPQ